MIDLKAYSKKLRLSGRNKEIILYSSVIVVAAILIVHGLIQEISDYHPRVQGAATKATPVASKTATPSSTLKHVSITLSPAVKYRITATPTFVPSATETLTVTPVSTSSSSRAVIQSVVAEKSSKQHKSVQSPTPTSEQCFLSLADVGSCPLGITIGKLHL